MLIKKQKEYFELRIESLRILGRWAADCAERALPIYEELNGDDPRPRDAINGIRVFANGGKRIAKLRVLALDAYRASLETEDPAASAAAQAASLAAAAAYTHPLVDVQQTKHILGSAAYAALAVEIKNNNDPKYGEDEVRLAVDRVQNEICEILLKMPGREEGTSRLDKIMFDLDIGLRNKYGGGPEGEE
ncbi:MAG: putative immunity protein [Candidatus Promineifilaceae bacterium]